MGNNYFYVFEDTKKIHIGKQSDGWAFVFHGYRDENHLLNSYYDWQKFLSQKGLCIIDDDGEAITKKDFFMLVDTSLPHKKISILNNQ